MEKQFIIKKVEKMVNEDTWSHLPKISIDCYLWETNGYKPRVEASVCYSDTGLHIHFTAWENNITIRSFNENGPVYKDSCVEFFLNPMPEKDSRYMNFEINAVGVLLLGIGSGRSDWGLLEKADHSLFGVRSSVPVNGFDSFNGPFWTIEYTIPFRFIKEYFIEFEPKPGKQMRANFY
ncbi:MAG: hypothetical protein A2Y21_00525, partial [Clostridiales bacterium GWC2_40_7]